MFRRIYRDQTETTTSSASGLVDKATSDLLIGPDWAMNLDICDVINNDPGQARDIVKAVRKRLSNKNGKVQLLALTVLETLVKNCGEIVHQQVAEKDILHEMVKIVKKKTDMTVRDKILELLDSWQEAFGGPAGKYPQYYTAYNDLRRCGVEFPQRLAQNAVPIFTPPQTQAVTAHGPSEYGSPAYTPAMLDGAIDSSDIPMWRSTDMDAAQSVLEILNEMLNALDPLDRQALKDDVIIQLVEQCRSNQRSIMQLVDTTSDERLLCQGLALNDDLQRVLAKYDAIPESSQIHPQDKSGSPKGNAVYDQEDDEDETEDESSQLAHRSSSRSQGLASGSLDNRSTSAHSVLPSPQPIKDLNLPPSAREWTVDLLTSQSFEARSPKTPASLAGASPRSEQVSSPISAKKSALNPFSGSPFVATPSYHAQKQQQSFDPNGIPSPSAQYSSDQQHQYCQGLGEPSPSGHNAPWASSNAESPGLQQQCQDSGRLQHPPQNSQAEVQQFKPEYQKAASWSSNAPQESQISGYQRKASPYVKNVTPNLPPPPKLRTQREQFFQQQTKLPNQISQYGYTTPVNLEQKVSNLTIQVGNQKQSANFQVRQTFPLEKDDHSTDRLFEDLVDLRSMGTNFKTTGISSNMSRPNTSKANGM